MRVRWGQTGLEKGIDKGRIEKLAEKICAEEGLKDKLEMSVSLVGEEEISELNRKYMGRQGMTDVLSFPLERETGPDGVVRLGDVVVGMPRAKEQAKDKQTSLQAEVEFLVAHGLRHLLGMHHD